MDELKALGVEPVALRSEATPRGQDREASAASARRAGS